MGHDGGNHARMISLLRAARRKNMRAFRSWCWLIDLLVTLHEVALREGTLKRRAKAPV